MKRTIVAGLFVIAAMLLAPTQVRADHTNTHTNVITCDFSALEDLMDELEVSDIKAPNDNARRGRLKSLNNALDHALDAAEEGDVDAVRDALTHIAKKANGRKNAWINGDVAEDLTDAIEDLMDCLDEHDDDDEDDEEEEVE